MRGYLPVTTTRHMGRQPVTIDAARRWRPSSISDLAVLRDQADAVRPGRLDRDGVGGSGVPGRGPVGRCGRGGGVAHSAISSRLPSPRSVILSASGAVMIRDHACFS